MVECAIILAAGHGSKIWPYGDTWPKAALPLANWPLIQWQIEAIQDAGIQTVYVVVHHLHQQIHEAVVDFEDVHLIRQTEIHGTADSLLCATQSISESEFLVVYGDTLFTQEAVQLLLQVEGLAALVRPVASHQSGEWLCANVDDGRIRQILGHPREASHQLCGLYALNRDIIPYLETNPGMMKSVEVGNMPPLDAELAESLSQFIQDEGELIAIENSGLYADLDKPWHYLDANEALLNHLGENLTENEIDESAEIQEGAEIEGFVVMGANSFIGHDVKIRGNLWVGDNTRIVDGAIIGGNTSIGSHTIVREYCRIEPGSSIGNHCIVGHAAEFGGILMDGAYSFHYGEFWGIIGRSTDLGAATVCGNLRFDDQITPHRIKGRRETPHTDSANAAYLGDFTRTGVNAMIMPGVKVGPYSIVGPGVIVNEDVPNNTLLYVRQTLEQRRWGPEKYGW